MPEFRTVLTIPFPDKETARNAYDSLIQETEFTKKSRAGLEVKGSELVVTIAAGDFASLRATVNSYTRLLAVFFGAKEAIDKSVNSS